MFSHMRSATTVPSRLEALRGPISSGLSLRSAALALLALQFLTPASADCECGYEAAIGGDADAGSFVFTELIETDFTGVKNISENTDWVRQAFNLTSARARGDFGEMFSIDDVVANPSGAQDPGLALTVRSEKVDGMVPTAEIDTQRLDVFWGTFRASMKLSQSTGTCAAFFWYFNDTQEIDMEFLNKDFNSGNASYPVNLVLQSRESAEAGYDAAKTGNFIKAYLPFNPTEDFHEYRVDYVPGHVYYYADGQLIAQMNGSAVPSSAGHLVLQHWSNGNAQWSGGPPTQDSALTVQYVKAYFNSTNATRNQDFQARCTDPSAMGAVCTIPDLNGTNSTAASWFFSGQDNMTKNETVSSGKNDGARPTPASWVTLVSFLVVTGRVAGMW